ncbi:hypothetical protein [Candidatus Amarolinea dominans]|nr:hypothetical protein [Anaerolineae bacterium]
MWTDQGLQDRNPQLQDFTYDALNRLTNGASGGTNGNYNSETYGFRPTAT